MSNVSCDMFINLASILGHVLTAGHMSGMSAKIILSISYGTNSISSAIRPLITVNCQGHSLRFAFNPEKDIN
jgi:hypothetical protein